MELRGELLLPLLGQMWGAEHGKGLDFTTIEQFACDETCFHGLADAHVIGDEQPDGIEPQGHQQRHELIRPRFDGNATETTERAGRRAGGDAGGITQQGPRLKITEVVARGEGKRGTGDGLDGREQASDFFIQPADGAEHEKVVRGIGQDNPLATARVNEGSGL